MPKMKSRRAATKRFKKTKTGKFLRRKSGLRHLLECKSNKSKRYKGRNVEISKSDVKRVKSMLAGG